MKFEQSTVLAVVPVLLLLFAGNDDNATELQKYLSKGAGAKGAVKGFFAGQDSESLSQLIFHNSADVWTFAAWERCKRQCSDLESAPYAKCEFLGFVSGKLNVPLPSWWKQEVENFRCEQPNSLPTLGTHQGFESTLGLRHDQGIEIASFGKSQISGTKNKAKFEIQLNLDFASLDIDNENHLETFSFVESECGRKIFAFGGRAASDFFVYCQTSNGDALWQTKVTSRTHLNTGGRLGLRTGFLELVVAQDRVLVFGANELSIFLNVISIENGETLSQFTTHY